MRAQHRESFKRALVTEVREDSDLIDSDPVLIRVDGETFEALAVPDITGEGQPYIRFDQIQEPETDTATELPEEPEALRTVDEVLGKAALRSKTEVIDAIAALTVSSLSGGEGIVDASGSRLKTIRYEPHTNNYFPIIDKSVADKPVPRLRKVVVVESEENIF